MSHFLIHKLRLYPKLWHKNSPVTTPLGFGRSKVIATSLRFSIKMHLVSKGSAWNYLNITTEAKTKLSKDFQNKKARKY